MGPQASPPNFSAQGEYLSLRCLSAPLWPLTQLQLLNDDDGRQLAECECRYAFRRQGPAGALSTSGALCSARTPQCFAALGDTAPTCRILGRGQEPSHQGQRAPPTSLEELSSPNLMVRCPGLHLPTTSSNRYTFRRLGPHNVCADGSIPAAARTCFSWDVRVTCYRGPHASPGGAWVATSGTHPEGLSIAPSASLPLLLPH